MGIWNKFFGKKHSSKPEKSPYLPESEDPVDIAFAKNFTKQGGLFLYTDSSNLVQKNFSRICQENNWRRAEVICLNQNLSQIFQTNFIDQTSGNLDQFKAILIECEFLISNTGKILLSNHQINHFKIKALPQTIIVIAKINQITRDVSEGMTLLKNKYTTTIPSNITTLNIINTNYNNKKNQAEETKAKNIYLLLEDF